jgi:hypothetical protein
MGDTIKDGSGREIPKPREPGCTGVLIQPDQDFGNKEIITISLRGGAQLRISLYEGRVWNIILDVGK